MAEQSTRGYDPDQEITEIAETQDQAQNGQGNSRQRTDTADESSGTFQLPMTEHEARLETENALLREQVKSTDLERANAEKEAQIARLEAAVAGAAVAPSAGKSKSVKPDKMRPYYGQSEGEHQRWFREVVIKYLRSPDYFVTDKDKILYCMESLEGDPANQWSTHTDDGQALEGVTYDDFKGFLLNLVADPANRRLQAYERWMKAEQKPNQRVTVFKTYLEELEGHMPILSETHRANFFLAKLKPDLKNLILRTGNVPEVREEILAIAIMQERTLERTRPAGGSENSGNHPPKGGSGGHKGGSGGGSGGSKGGSSGRNGPGHKGQGNHGSSGNSSHRGGRHSNPQSSGQHMGNHTVEHIDQKDVICFHCNQRGHYAKWCPQKDRPAVKAQVGAVDSRGSEESKNDEAPQPPRKRSRKDQ